mmetsp:Transcript_7442/g.8404  ORF Transcript_7442/g.8404 Transcript_7442/m.8404 type:complete len:84 (+) Transcript_7442:227-478(+)
MKILSRGRNKSVALKKLTMVHPTEGFPITAMREIVLLKRLQHHNIVQLQDIFPSRQSEANKNKGSFYLQFEYVKHDLQGLLNK